MRLFPVNPIVAAMVIILSLSPANAFARVFALTIGIDEYHTIPDLEGTVNDSNDLVAALKSHPDAEIVQLLNAEATREAVLNAWNSLTDKAGLGDHLIFHFAGHGSTQNAIRKDAGEAMDNMFLLAGFDTKGRATRERIIDNEMAFLLRQEKEATILFVADSCFSGGMARSAATGPRLSVRRLPRVVSFETGQDTLRQHIMDLGVPPKGIPSNVMTIYASGSAKEVPEIPIDGQKRGALSYALARALEGAADKSDDGIISAKELRRFIRRQVRAHAKRLQHPQIEVGRDVSQAFSLKSGEMKIDTGIRVFHEVSPEIPVLGKALDTELRQENVNVVEDMTSADLIFELTADKFQIYNNTRDLVFSAHLTKDLRGFCSNRGPEECLKAYNANARFEAESFLAKFRFLEKIAFQSGKERLSVEAVDGDRVYLAGERVRIWIQTETSSKVLPFAIDQNGYLKALAPKPFTVEPGKRVSLGKLEIQEPYGADHLFLLSGMGDDLARWIRLNSDYRLARAPKDRDFPTVGEGLMNLLNDPKVSIDALPVFTAQK